MKSLFVIFIILINISSVLAADIRDLDIGDGVYVQGILSDEPVYVIRLNYTNNLVKVRRSKDGMTAWVNSSQLITHSESTANDIARGVLAAGLFFCALDPNSCK